MQLLILGASARAAAFSALRIGIKPICADLFGDVDLADCCQVTQVASASYPSGLASFAETLEATRWLYTGAIENHPDLVDRISRRHSLLGNPGPVLRAVRDPFAVARAMLAAGLRTPSVRERPVDLPVDGSWLIKPTASGGGRGIRRWTGAEVTDRRAVYFQERIAGLSLSAVFVGDGQSARCEGITRQFVGKPGNPFAYRASLGPWPVADPIRDQIEQIGRTLAGSFGLLGLFGVDLILEAGQIWPIEVNPRYTASVEVLEWALGRSLLAEHLGVLGCDFSSCNRSPKAHGFVGKAIIHADRAFQWHDTFTFDRGELDQLPALADIPHPGTAFERGDPVLTVLASGDTPFECRRRLGGMVRQWRTRLRGA